MDDAPAVMTETIFHLQRSGQADYELGAFRRWAGYKSLGVEEATQGLAHLQHVLSFGPCAEGGRTGIHCHLAQVHLVIPTSGLGVFSYDGVITEAAPGAVIVQHGGTVHDQFQYSYAPASAAENAATPQALSPAETGAPERSFGFLELFVPQSIAHVEIVPPAAVTAEDQASAWRHPYHAPDARYALQAADDPGAVFHPVAGQPGLEARDAATWGPTGGLAATWILRAAAPDGATAEPKSLDIPGESGGIEIYYVVAGSATFAPVGAAPLTLGAGDTLTCSQGLVGLPTSVSPDLSLLRLFLSARARRIQARTPEEIRRLEALGPGIVTGRRLRAPGDDLPINGLQSEP